MSGSPTTPSLTISDIPKEGDDVTLTCHSQSQSIPDRYRLPILYSWSREGIPIDPSDPLDRHTVTGHHGQNLVISPLTRTDNQVQYQCEAREDTSMILSDSVSETLNVRCEYCVGAKNNNTSNNV